MVRLFKYRSHPSDNNEAHIKMINLVAKATVLGTGLRLESRTRIQSRIRSHICIYEGCEHLVGVGYLSPGVSRPDERGDMSRIELFYDIYDSDCENSC